jgi:hypothetical protein
VSARHVIARPVTESNTVSMIVFDSDAVQEIGVSGD